MYKLWSLLLLASLMGQAESRLRITTENYPPFNMTLDGGDSVTGIATEIVRAALDKAGQSAEIKLFPWARAYRMAMDLPGTCVYSTTRTPERESLFKWVGPLVSNDWVLWARPNWNKPIAKLDDVRSHRIGGYLDDAVSSYLKREGYNVDEAVADHLNAHKLDQGRIDLWATGRLLGQYLAMQEKVPGLKVVLEFKKTQMYLACHPDVADATIAKLNQAIEDLGREGRIQQIHQKYLNASPK